MSIKGFNINGNIEKIDYNSLENLPDISGGSTNEEWELLQDTNDIEIRAVTQQVEEKYKKYVICIDGVATTSSTWRLVTAPISTATPYINSYLSGTVCTHVYGGGTYFFIELPQNAPAMLSKSDSVVGGNGVGTIRLAYLTLRSENVKSFGLKADDATLEYTKLSIRVWGVKA